ncbi:MAG: CBS domain-containing protein [Reyranella sp.]|nr:CBS domain-containing protein [Reyranella sp.]
MKVGDVMTANVVCIGPQATVLEAARLLLGERISALPVVDGAGRLVGILSEGDLIHRAEIGSDRPARRWTAVFADGGRLARDFLKAHGRTVAEVMSKKVVTVGETTNLAEVAALMDEHRVKRLPVVRDGRIVGIVSRANLLQAMVSLAPEAAAPAVSDADLRREILTRIGREPWAQTVVRNVIVADGNVELWGHAETAAQCEAFAVLVREVPGVKSVVNNMAVTPSGVYML